MELLFLAGSFSDKKPCPDKILSLLTFRDDKAKILAVCLNFMEQRLH